MLTTWLILVAVSLGVGIFVRSLGVRIAAFIAALLILKVMMTWYGVLWVWLPIVGLTFTISLLRKPPAFPEQSFAARWSGRKV